MKNFILENYISIFFLFLASSVFTLSYFCKSLDLLSVRVLSIFVALFAFSSIKSVYKWMDSGHVEFNIQLAIVSIVVGLIIFALTEYSYNKEKIEYFIWLNDYNGAIVRKLKKLRPEANKNENEVNYYGISSFITDPYFDNLNYLEKIYSQEAFETLITTVSSMNVANGYKETMDQTYSNYSLVNTEKNIINISNVYTKLESDYFNQIDIINNGLKEVNSYKQGVSK